jgi:hypothetical protein
MRSSQWQLEMWEPFQQSLEDKAKPKKRVEMAGCRTGKIF